MTGEDGFYIGKRLSYDGALCTVRYHGPLSRQTGSWLGVEWDDESRGKHQGTHMGKRMFYCQSNSKTAASFIRPSRPSDQPRAFLEALRFKYGGKGQAAETEKPVEISGKTVEEVGFEKIRRQQAELQGLRVAVLDDLQLSGIMTQSSGPGALQRAQNDIAWTCPNIIELDIGWSLLEKWQDVADICRALTKLRILKVSGVRLHSFSVDVAEASACPVPGIEELHLNETLLHPAQLPEMLNNHFPALRTLSLAENQLDSLISSDTSQTLYLPALSTLILDKNAFKDLSSLAAMSRAFPNLKDLSLQQNNIDTIGILNLTQTSTQDMFTNLRSLNLSGNEIKDFHFIDVLSLLFSNLASLRISKNPLYTDTSAIRSDQATTQVRSDIPYSFTLARIPSLTALNHTTITAQDREEGEIYYLSAAGREIIALLEVSNTVGSARDITTRVEQARARHPRYEALCSKYDRDSVLEKYNIDPASAQSGKQSLEFAANSLAARLVEARFYVPGPAQKVLQRSIARTIDVYRIKALISRELGLRPLQFRLIYESEELDPVRNSPEQNFADWETWGDWDVDGDGESGPEGTAAPEQARDESWIDGVLLKDGRNWKKREVEILDGNKAWGDYIGDDEIRTVSIRVEPYDVS